MALFQINRQQSMIDDNWCTNKIIIIIDRKLNMLERNLNRENNFLLFKKYFGLFFNLKTKKKYCLPKQN